MMEPTDNELHAGCLGNINATWTFTRALRALRAALARPTTRSTRAALGIAALAAHRSCRHDFDGLTFYEVASVTRIERRDRHERDPGDRARRTSTSATRPAARRSEAEARLRELTGGLGELDGHRQLAVAAPVAVEHPPSTRLIEAGTSPSRPSRRGRRSPSSRPRASRGQLRPGRARPGAPPRRVGRDRRAAARLPACLEAFGTMTGSPPRSPGSAPTRSCASSEARARLRAAGVDFDRLRDGRAARGDAGVHPRGARGRDQPLAPYPSAGRAARAARGDRRLGAAPLRRRARPRHARSSRRSAPRRRSSQLAQVVRRRAGRPCRRPPTPSTSAARRSPASGVLELPLTARRAAGCPTSTPSRLGSASACCGSTTPTTRRPRPAPRRVLRARRRAGARARLRARLRRGLLGALLRRRAAGCPRCRSPTARNVPSSTRSPSARRCPATAPGSSPATPRSSPRSSGTGRTSAWRRWSSSSAPRSRPGATRRHVEEVRGRYRAKRDVLLPALEARRPALRRAATRRSSSGSTPARTPTRSPRGWLEAGVVVAPGSFFGAAGEGFLRMALVPPLAELRARGQPARASAVSGHGAAASS